MIFKISPKCYSVVMGVIISLAVPGCADKSTLKSAIVESGGDIAGASSKKKSVEAAKASPKQSPAILSSGQITATIQALRKEVSKVKKYLP